jgi:hypothetical protein
MNMTNDVANGDLPTTGQVITVRRVDEGRLVHLHGEVVEVRPEEGFVVIEHPAGVDRFLWFPERDMVWREAVG